MPSSGGKRKREKNNQSRGQKSCLSARSVIYNIVKLKWFFKPFYFHRENFEPKKEYIEKVGAAYRHSVQ